MSAPKNLCPGCMSDQSGLHPCPSCGWDGNTILDNSLYLPAGYLLNNRYAIGKVIGVGGFGVVYIAWDTNLDVRAAIKEFLPREYAARSSNHISITPYTGSANEEFSIGVEKFLEEAKALARFQDHSGIVTVHESFRTNNTAYMVMQYLDGMTMKEYLKRQPGEKIAFNMAVKAMTPIMDALREVHNAGFVHRDISPDNIFLTSQNQVKLLDFGSARYAIGEHSKSLTSVLKHGYAPVEQYSVKGKQGPWSDVYAVCATLYRCVTGFVPPDAMERIQGDTIKSPKQLGIDIPERGELAIMRGLALKAYDRFESIQQLQQALTTGEMPAKQMGHGEVIIQSRPSSQNVIKCPKCGVQNQLKPGDDPHALRCGKCKSELNLSPVIVDSAINSSLITEEDFAAYIGNNADKYLTEFKKFNINGTDTFSATWNWPAFFVPGLWMLYRKLYLWALLVFVLARVPYAYFILMIGFGISGNYIYYKHAKKKLIEIKKLFPPSSRAMKIARVGGVNNSIAMILILIAIIGILAAIAIPQFIQYRARGYVSAINADCKNAYTASVAFNVDNPNSTITTVSLKLSGYEASPGINTEVTSWIDNNNYTITCTGDTNWNVGKATMSVVNGELTFIPASIKNSSEPEPIEAPKVEAPVAQPAPAEPSSVEAPVAQPAPAADAPTSIEDSLMSEIKKREINMNSGLPKMVSKNIRADKVIVGPGKNITYIYTVINLSSSDVKKDFYNDVKQNLIKETCNGKTQILFQNGVTLIYRYYGSDDIFIADIPINPSDCGY